MNLILLSLLNVLFALFLAPLVLGVTRYVQNSILREQALSPVLPYVSLYAFLKNVVAGNGGKVTLESVAGIVAFACGVVLALSLPLIVVRGAFENVGGGVAALVLALVAALMLFSPRKNAPYVTVALFMNASIVFLAFVTFALFAGSINLGDIATAFSLTSGVWENPGLFVSLLSLLALALIPALKIAREVGEQKTLLTTSGEIESPDALAKAFPSMLLTTVACALAGNILLPTAFIVETSTFMTVIIVMLIVALKTLVVAAAVSALSTLLRRSPVFGARELSALAWLLAFGGLITVVAQL